MFVDSIGLLLLTLPIVMPLVDAIGLDLVLFGIIAVKLLEIGLVTPPVGLNVYVIKGTLGDVVALPTIFRGVGWFVVMDLIALASSSSSLPSRSGCRRRPSADLRAARAAHHAAIQGHCPMTKLILRNARIVDVRAGSVAEPSDLMIAGDRIADP